jgi:hypothetical protein
MNITSVLKHISFTLEIDMVLLLQNIKDIWHILRIIEIENPVPKMCLSHSEKHEIAYVITVKDNNSERKCGIRAPTPGET